MKRCNKYVVHMSGQEEIPTSTDLVVADMEQNMAIVVRVNIVLFL